jgi:hypothetical protein
MSSNAEPRSLSQCLDGCMSLAHSLSRICAELPRHRAQCENPELAAITRRYESILEDVTRQILLTQSSISEPVRKLIWPAGTEPLQLLPDSHFLATKVLKHTTGVK